MLEALQSSVRRGRNTTLRTSGTAVSNKAQANPTLATNDSKAKVEQRFFRTRALDELPISLKHERIYILPTQRGLLFICGLLIMLVTSMNYALGLGYALCFLLTGLFSAALMATYRNVQGITLTDATASHCTLGDLLQFELQLENPNRLDMHVLSVSDRIGHITELPFLGSQQSARVSLRVATEKRGWQSLGRLRVRSEYPLGLWFAWGYWHVPVQGLVLPRSELDAPPLPHSRADHDEEGDSEQQHAQAFSGEIHAIRPYQSGDNLSSIHWKSSARGQGLHTREFETAQAPQSMALQWGDTDTLSDKEARVARLAAWCHECDEEARPFSLALPGQAAISNTDSGHENSGSSGMHLHECLRALALFDSQNPNPDGNRK